MNDYNGYIKGLYNYVADSQGNIKKIFSKYFKVNINDVKIAFRQQDLELMILVNLDKITYDDMIMLTISRLDEYKFNYDNDNLLELVINDFISNNRQKKIIKIRDRIK